MSPQPSQSPLDRTTLAVATVASVLGAMVTSAVGTGFLGSLIAAAIVPAVTAFLIHPGPHQGAASARSSRS